MARKFRYKYLTTPEINFKNHWAVGTVWNVLASNKKSSYNIEMKDKGFTCSCPAFRKCKHIKVIEEGFCYDG